MSLYRDDTNWGFDVGNFLLFSWERGAFVTIDLHTPKYSYGFACNFKRWRESDIWIKVTPPWDQVINHRPKRFEFSRRPAVMEF